METHFFEHNHNRLAYCRFGSGEQVMLAFHGFGQHKGVFRNLGTALGNEFTLYSFDLFFHGESHWHSKKLRVSRTGWKDLMQAFLTEKNIERFALCGFSMGGKFVLATLDTFPDRVTQLLFIAPDGIKTSFWYSLATYPGWTQQVFRKVVLNPRRFQQFTALMQKAGLADKSLVRFAQSQLLTRQQRLRVYYSWLLFKDLSYDMEAIAHLINTRNIAFRMFLGKYDRVITKKNMHLLLKHLTCPELHLLESGHNTLIENTAAFLSKG